jgi:hypothetical protein
MDTEGSPMDIVERYFVVAAATLVAAGVLLGLMSS